MLRNANIPANTYRLASNSAFGEMTSNSRGLVCKPIPIRTGQAPLKSPVTYTEFTGCAYAWVLGWIAKDRHRICSPKPHKGFVTEQLDPLTPPSLRTLRKTVCRKWTAVTQILSTEMEKYVRPMGRKLLTVVSFGKPRISTGRSLQQQI